MNYQRIDATDHAAFSAWFDVLQRSETLRDGDRNQGWHPDEWRARAVDLDAPIVHHLFSFGDNYLAPVAVGALEVSRVDNLRWMRGELFVDPSERRQGYGTQALKILESLARDFGRESLSFWVIEGASEVGASPSHAFSSATGYSLMEQNIRRDIAWPRPLGELQRLQAENEVSATGYEILAWLRATPPSFLAKRAALFEQTPLEVPSNNELIEKEQWDEERVRSHEQEVDAMGRDLLISCAIEHATQELVGYSELTVSRDQPHTAYQWETMVLPRHRGHRLGILMKLATMRLLSEGGYQTERISTFNAFTNQSMIRVNEELGGTVAGAMVAWTKKLAS